MVRLRFQFASDWKLLDWQATACEPLGPVNHRGPQRQVQSWRRYRCHPTDMQSCCGVWRVTDLHACHQPVSYAR